MHGKLYNRATIGVYSCLNSRQLLHDENDFGPDVEKFIPERFLRPGIRDPASTGSFGFGRR